MKTIGLCSTGLILALALPAVGEELAPEKKDNRAAEYVYEGRAASEWAKELKAGNPKAAHALGRLGKDAILPLLPLLRDADVKTSAAAEAVLSELPVDKQIMPVFVPLLKDEHFEVRRTAVKLLAKYALMDHSVAGMLQEMLQDRDKAVAETAEDALKLGEIEPLLDEARGSLKQGDAKRAMLLADRVLALNPNEIRARELKLIAQETAERARVDEGAWLARKEADEQRMAKKKTVEALLVQAREMFARGELDTPLRIVAEAQKLFPDDPGLAQFRQQLEARKKNGKAAGKPGDINPFD